MKITVNRAAIKRKKCLKVFNELEAGDFESVQIIDESGDVVAELLYDPDLPLKNGAHAWLQVYDETKVRLK